MSTADRSAGEDDTASAVASVCHDAEFVQLVATADGDALAATGVLARTLTAIDIPFQASIAEPTATPTRGTETDLTIALGRDDMTAIADHTISPGPAPLSETAFAVAHELGIDADPVLALAGGIAADVPAPETLIEAVTQAGIEQRTGVAVPTVDVADGLAHSTLVHAPFSGEPEQVKATLADLNLLSEATGNAADLDADDRRRIASMVGIRTVGADSSNERAADAVAQLLAPRAIKTQAQAQAQPESEAQTQIPFETVGGYSDVLDAVAREQPGTGVALALGHDAAEPALDAWRTHGERAHQALKSATTGRYDGLYVARASGADFGVSEASDVPVGTAARLLRDFRSPEPVALFVTDGRAAAAATTTDACDTDIAATMETAATAIDGQAAGTSRRAQITFQTDTAELIMAFREAL